MVVTVEKLFLLLIVIVLLLLTASFFDNLTALLMYQQTEPSAFLQRTDASLMASHKEVYNKDSNASSLVMTNLDARVGGYLDVF